MAPLKSTSFAAASSGLQQEPPPELLKNVLLRQAIGRTLLWQLALALVLAIVALLVVGWVGVGSVLLGCAVVVAGLLAFGSTYAWMVKRMRRRWANSPSPETASLSANMASITLRTALRAEAVKVIVMVLLLWAVFQGVANLVPFAFISAFVLSVLLSGIVFAASFL